MTKVANPQDKKVKNDSRAWQFLCSVKLAVIIIIILAVACILGTVILQMRPPEIMRTDTVKALRRFSQQFNSQIYFIPTGFHFFWYYCV
jgi:cytochrome c biogenesis protein ResB